jgi:hypothetical protein
MSARRTCERQHHAGFDRRRVFRLIPSYRDKKDGLCAFFVMPFAPAARVSASLHWRQPSPRLCIVYLFYVYHPIIKFGIASCVCQPSYAFVSLMYQPSYVYQPHTCQLINVYQPSFLRVALIHVIVGLFTCSIYYPHRYGSCTYPHGVRPIMRLSASCTCVRHSCTSISAPANYCRPSCVLSVIATLIGPRRDIGHIIHVSVEPHFCDASRYLMPACMKSWHQVTSLSSPPVAWPHPLASALCTRVSACSLRVLTLACVSCACCRTPHRPNTRCPGTR